MKNTSLFCAVATFFFSLFSVPAVAGVLTPPAAVSTPLAVWSKITAKPSGAFLSGEEMPPVRTLAPGAVEMPVRFSGKSVARANWDVMIPCDLRGRPGLQFDFYCGDLEQFSSFSIYFKSGKGWYHCSFSPEESGVWQRVTVLKTQAHVEGGCAGWGAVSQIRVSGWRVGTNDTVCAMANLAYSGSDPDLAIVYADAAMSKGGGEAKGYMTFAANVATSLEALGVSTVLIADTDLAPELLKNVRAVVLPYNPGLTADKMKILEDFREKGGKFLVCYSGNSRLCGLVDVLPGSYVRPSDCGLPAIAGFLRTGDGFAEQPAFVPQASWMACRPKLGKGAVTVADWADAKKNSIGLPALTRSPHGFYMSHVWLGGTEGPQAELMRAITCDLVPGLSDKMAARAAAREKAARETRAWLAGLSSVPGEHRAFWCHSARGLGGGRTWDESIRFLKENGFNAVLPNLCWAGTAFYQSDVLPVSSTVSTEGDALESCLSACRKYGVKCHVWKVCWNMGAYATKAFEEKMAAAGRTQVGFKGETYTRWLCPSHPDNQKLEIDAMVELAKKGPDGIHFDYIRYPDAGHCFCEGCRKRFEAACGAPVADWPADIRKDPRMAKRWTAFRTAQITAVVRGVAARVRDVAPGVQISAAVFRNPETDPETIGQDWSLWCRKGWLDFVCPMDYVDSSKMFESQVRAQMKAVGSARIYPGIGLSCWQNDGRDAVKLAGQIQAARKLGLTGWTIFNFDRRAEKVLPLMRLGLTKESTQPLPPQCRLGTGGTGWRPSVRWRGFNLLEMFFMGSSRKPGDFREEDFQMIHDWGFNFVRLPMDYRYWIKDGDWNRFNEENMKVIDRAVALGRKYGVHVMLNFHRAPGYTVAQPREKTDLFTDTETQRVCCRHWAFFARRYRGIPNEALSFNLFNEPPSDVTDAAYGAVAKKIIDAIRAEDPDRFIVTDGLAFGRHPVKSLYGVPGVGQSTRGYEPMSVSHYLAPWVGTPSAAPVWPIRIDAPSGLLAGSGKPDLRCPFVLENLPGKTSLSFAFSKISGRVKFRFSADGETLAEKVIEAAENAPNFKDLHYFPEWKIWQGTYTGTVEIVLSKPVARLAVSVAEGDWATLTGVSLVSDGGRFHTHLAVNGDYSVPVNFTQRFTGWNVGFTTAHAKGTAPTPRDIDAGRAYLEARALHLWDDPLTKDIFCMAGEFGVWKMTPHAITLDVMEDYLSLWKERNMGWALWNFRGSFGVLDSERTDVEYENFRGHKLDRKMLTLLRRY